MQPSHVVVTILGLGAGFGAGWMLAAGSGGAATPGLTPAAAPVAAAPPGAPANPPLAPTGPPAGEVELLRGEVARLQADLEQSREERRFTERKWVEVQGQMGELREQYQVMAKELQAARAGEAALEDGAAPDPDGRQRKTLLVGEPITDEAAAALQLDTAQRQSVDAAITAEDTRMAEAVRDLIHRHFPDKVPAELDGKSAAQLVVGNLLDKLMPEIQELQSAQAKAAAAGEDPESVGIWEVLDDTSVAWKLAEAMAGARAGTYDQLRPVLSDDQLGALRETYLPPHDFIFPGNLNFGFGPFPDDANAGK